MSTDTATTETPALIRRLRSLETLARTANDHSRRLIDAEWRAICRELNRRATDEILAAS